MILFTNFLQNVNIVYFLAQILDFFALQYFYNAAIEAQSRGQRVRLQTSHGSRVKAWLSSAANLVCLSSSN